MQKNVIGQDHVLNELDAIFEVFVNSKGMIRPHFILAGPSGNGKTRTVNHLVQKYKLPLLEINGAQLTKEGMSGNSLSKALSGLKNFQNDLSVVFVDEFDKLYITSNGDTDDVHEATRGVQNEFLQVLESSTTQVFGDYGKFNTVTANKTLFIFAGAFNNKTNLTIEDLLKLGVKREFLGRVNLFYEIKKLTLEELIEILKSSSLLHDYLKLINDAETRGYIELGAIKKISSYIEKHYDENIIGARWIDSIIHKFFIRKGNIEEKNKPEMKVVDESKSLDADDFNLSVDEFQID